MKIIIYTALFGDTDKSLKELGDLAAELPSCQGAEYVAFTNRKDLKSDLWTIKQVELKEKSPRLDARYYKLNSHKVLPLHDYSIWLDHCVRFKKAPDTIINHYLKKPQADIAMHHHADVNSLALEAILQCWEHHNDDPTIIMDQMIRYGKKGFPMLGYHHFETAIVLRQNNANVEKFNEMWWEEVLSGSLRDQLSAPYVAWCCRKGKIKIHTLLETYTAHLHRLDLPQSQVFFTVPKPLHPEDVAERAKK